MEERNGPARPRSMRSSTGPIRVQADSMTTWATPANRPHLEPGEGFDKDPAFFHTARTGFGSRRNTPWRVSCTGHIEALYGNSIRLRYTGLDPAAHYRIRFTQSGDGTPRATSRRERQVRDP